MIINNINMLMKYLNSLSLKDFKKNFDFLGEGIARKVFSLNHDLVIKVAKGEDGLHQNFVEAYVYKNTPPNLKRYLCPVCAYNKKILLMKKAEVFPSFRKDNYINVENLREEDSLLADLHLLEKQFFLFREDLYAKSSWGFIDDNFYLIDYGCTNPRGDLIYELLMKKEGLL